MPTSRTLLSVLAFSLSLISLGAQAQTAFPYLNDNGLRACLNEQSAKNGWQYAEQVTTLSCSAHGIVRLEGIAAFSKLQDLDLSNNQLTDVSPLSGLSQLGRLNLAGNRTIIAASLPAVFGSNATLSSLNLNGINIIDPGSIGYLINPRTGLPLPLIELDLGNTNLSDISGSRNLDFLRPFSKLKKLSASGLRLSNVNVLSNLPQLEQLDLSYNELGSNGYFPLTNLKSLNLAGNRLMPPGMIDAMISINPKLTAINLNGIPVGDFRSLGSLFLPLNGIYRNLTELDLGNTHIKDTNGLTTLSFLQPFPNLTKLNLANNGITDASALSAMVKLSELDLSGGQLSSVTKLNSLHGLTRLNLSGNRNLLIADVSANLLNTNPNLTSVGLNGIFIGPAFTTLNLYNSQAGRPNALTELDIGNTLVDPQALGLLGYYYPMMQRLNLAGNSLPANAPWNALRSMTQMQDIDLSDNRIADVSAILGWTQLSRMILGNTSLRQADIRSMIEQNPRLNALGLNGINMFDASMLGNLNNNQTGQPLNLTELDLGNAGISAAQNWDFLLKFPSLKRLNLAGNNIGQIDQIKSLTGLVDLDLSNNNLTQLPLLASRNISRLNLSGNKALSSANIGSVLSGLPSVTSLSLYGIAIGAINNIGNLNDPVSGKPYDLTELDLGNTGVLAVGNLKNVNFLTNFPNLSRLNLAGNTLSDIGVLANLRGVSDLDLSNNQIATLAPLGSYRSLTRLVLSGNTGLTTAQIKPLLAQNLNLQRLGLAGITLFDFSNLGSLVNPIRNTPYDLRELDLSNTRLSANGNLGASIVFQRFRNLQTVNLAGNGLSDATLGSGLPYLTDLDLSNNLLADVSQIQNLRTLRRINLGGNSKITSIAVSTLLYNNPDLISIGFNGINLGSLAAIGNLNKQLTGAPMDLLELDLGNSGLKDINGLAFLSRFAWLQRLNLAGNGISATSGLSYMPHLRELDLSNNPLSYVGDLPGLRTLRTLNLSGDSAIACVDLTSLGNTLVGTVITRPATCASKNAPPTANAGANQSVASGSIVNLSGSAYDSDGSIASYAWKQISGPAVTLVRTNTVTSGFTAPTLASDTVFSFQLTVFDNMGASATSTTNVTVKGKPNLPPVVSAGPNQTVLGDRIVALSGTASDSDGTIVSYSWAQTSGPTAPANPGILLLDANTATAHFYPVVNLTDTVLGFTLTVTDNRGATSSSTTTVTVKGNLPPVASPGPDQIVYAGNPVSLNGSGYDPDGTVTAFWWTQLSGPTVTLSNGYTASAQFVAPQVASDTVLVFQFMVTDNRNLSIVYNSRVTVKPNALPLVNAGSNQSVIGGNGVTLSGTASDSDGSIASYTWVQTAGPAVTLATPNAASTTFATTPVSANTTLSFKLTVQDDHGAVASSNLNVTLTPVPNQPPVVNAGQNQTVQKGSNVTLSGYASDAEGYVASYAWVQTSGPAVTLLTPNSRSTDFVAPNLPDDAVLGFQLTAVDNQGAASVANVTVTATEFPDLVIESIDGWSRFMGVSYGFNVNTTIRNLGKAAMVGNNVKVNFYMSTDQYRLSSDAIAIGSSFSALNLAPGEAVTLSLPAFIPLETPFRQFFMVAVIDESNQITESNDNNNVKIDSEINPF